MPNSELPGQQRDIGTEGGDYYESIKGNHIRANEVKIYEQKDYELTDRKPFPTEYKFTVPHKKIEGIYKKQCWLWLLQWLSASALIHNVLGLFKANDYLDNRFHWVCTFWLPPIFIGVTSYFIGLNFINQSQRSSKNVMFIWWLSVFAITGLDQIVPYWFHIVQFASLVTIGIVGNISWSTGWAFLGKLDRSHNAMLSFANAKQFLRISILVSYGIILIFTFISIFFVWFIPDSHFLPFPSPDSSMLFRAISSTEMLAAFILISVGFYKLILIPIFSK